VVVTPNDGERWLEELASRFKGYLWAIYDPQPAPEMRVAWDPAKHPHEPAGSGKGGEWAHTTGGAAVAADEAHLVEEKLLHGVIKDLKPLDRKRDTHGVNWGLMGTARVGGKVTYIKAQDPDRERAAYEVNAAMGNLVDMPVTVVRETPVALRRGKSIDGTPAEPRAAFSVKGLGETEHDYSEMPRGPLRDMAVFDAVIGNNDRHLGNILYDPKTQHVTAIDHGLCLQTLASRRDGGGNLVGIALAESARSGLPPTLTAKQRSALKKCKQWLRDGGRARLESMDIGFHPIYEGVDGMVKRVHTGSGE
jgi:hypothetical protein